MLQHRIDNIRKEVDDKEMERVKLRTDLDCSKLQVLLVIVCFKVNNSKMYFPTGGGKPCPTYMFIRLCQNIMVN